MRKGKSLDPDYHKKYYRKHRDYLKEQERLRYHRMKTDPAFQKKIKESRERRHFGHTAEEVFARFDFCCAKCKNPAEIVHHLDHDGRNLEAIGKLPGTNIDRLEALCRRCHMAEHRTMMIAHKRIPKNGYWSIKHDCCIACGTTSRKHTGRGLCCNCHASWRYNLKKQREPGV